MSHSYVEVQLPSITVHGDGALQAVIQVKWSHGVKPNSQMTGDLTRKRQRLQRLYTQSKGHTTTLRRWLSAGQEGRSYQELMLWEKTLYCFSHLVCGILLWQLEQSNIAGLQNIWICLINGPSLGSTSWSFHWPSDFLKSRCDQNFQKTNTSLFPVMRTTGTHWSPRLFPVVLIMKNCLYFHQMHMKHLTKKHWELSKLM